MVIFSCFGLFRLILADFFTDSFVCNNYWYC